MTTSPITRPRTRRSSGPALAFAAVLGLPYVIGILVLTLTPRGFQSRMPQVLDLVLGFAHHTLGWQWLGFTKLELMANVLVFVPIGVLAFLLLRAWPLVLALLVGPLLSFGVELVQATLLPHRVASLMDVAANTLGATAGVILAWAMASLVHALRRRQ